MAELAVKRSSADYLNAMSAVTPPAQLTPVALSARSIDPPTTYPAPELTHRKLRRAGIDAELRVREAMPHAGFGFGHCP